MTYSHSVDNLWITLPFLVGRVKTSCCFWRDSRGCGGFSYIDMAVYLHFVNNLDVPQVM